MIPPVFVDKSITPEPFKKTRPLQLPKFRPHRAASQRLHDEQKRPSRKSDLTRIRKILIDMQNRDIDKVTRIPDDENAILEPEELDNEYGEFIPTNDYPDETEEEENGQNDNHEEGEDLEIQDVIATQPE